MRRIAIAGASGFVGSHLLLELASQGHRIRALVRDPGKISHPGVDICVVDLDTGDGLEAGLRDADVAVWLVHRMAEGSGFAAKDADAARRFSAMARSAGVGRIVYLGGIVPAGAELSEHLASRAEVGDALRSAGVPVTELRAGIVLGAGSASFEILRQLTEHLPVMVTPKWVHNRTQPIAVSDLAGYLARVCVDDRAAGRSFEVGGPEVLTFLQMMRRFARHRGLSQWVFPVPVLTPRLSSRWVGLVTDVDPVLARPLIESLVHETVCTDTSIREIDDRELMGFEAAIDAAILEARRSGRRTRMGRDARYVSHLAVGMALDWAAIEVTGSTLPGGIEVAFAILTALGLYATASLGEDRTGSLDPDIRAITAGAVAGVATALASGAFVGIAGSNPSVRRASLRTLNRDRAGAPVSPAVLAAMGAAEELYWRGVLQHKEWARGRTVPSVAGWAASVTATRDPILSLSAVTLGPVWAALSDRYGPVAAATAHAIWLPAARWMARRMLGDGGEPVSARLRSNGQTTESPEGRCKRGSSRQRR